MAAKFKIFSVRKVFNTIVADDARGVDYVLNHRFISWDSPKLHETIKKIREAGEIDLRYWHKARKGEA